MSKKIRKYAKEELDSGSSPEEVKTTLIAAGWEEEEVEKSLNKVLNGDDSQEVKFEDDEDVDESTRSHEEKVRLFLFVLVIVLMVLLFLGVFLAFTSLDPQVIFG